MKSRLITYLYYTLFWMVLFFISRLGFLIYNYEFAFGYPFSDWIKIFLYGLKLDLSLTGYILILPTIIFITGNLISNILQRIILNSYTILLIIGVVIIALADAELYRNWGFKIDKTSLIYLKTPKEAMASSQNSLIILFFISSMISISVLYLIYLKVISKRILEPKKAGWKNSVMFTLIFFLLFLPIRGGFSIATINASAVYFHNDLFPNHSAVNAPWNVLYSLSVGEDEDSYSYFTNDKMNEILSEKFIHEPISEKVINTSTPNIMIIILESFTAKVIEPLGGEKDISPNFTKLCKEGILFDNFYANGSRSDKGLVSIISGFPAQPTTSIMKFPGKTQHLPFLNLSLKEKGYHSSFYYGGNLNFANFKSYFVNGKFDTLITGDNFPSKMKTGKWGVPDHLVFDRLLNDINDNSHPFLNILFTLSSHDPFDVPMEDIFEGNDEDSRYRNAIYYTDKSLGNFIEKAKKESWWDNTVCILIADHGSRLPGNIKFNSLEKFRIPMLWIGGALNKRDTIVSTYGSQVDIATTILSQLDIVSEQYLFGNNLFSQTHNDFSFFVFNNGFGYIDKNNYYIYDNVSNRIINKSDSLNKDNLDFGKAYLQRTMEVLRNNSNYTSE